MFAPSARCRHLDSLAAHRAVTLIVPVWVTANGGFERRVPDASRRFLLAVVALALLVLVGDEHGCLTMNPIKFLGSAGELSKTKCFHKES